jgi:hypothetical protein
MRSPGGDNEKAREEHGWTLNGSRQRISQSMALRKEGFGKECRNAIPYSGRDNRIVELMKRSRFQSGTGRVVAGKMDTF